MTSIIYAPQRIEMVYNGKAHWFKVQRYTTPQELYTALLNDGLQVDSDKLAAFTATYPATVADQYNDECGRMYLLGSTIEVYAAEAVKMAFGIMYRTGAEVIDTSPAESLLAKDIALIAGAITSQLYAQSKYY